MSPNDASKANTGKDGVARRHAGICFHAANTVAVDRAIQVFVVAAKYRVSANLGIFFHIPRCTRPQGRVMLIVIPVLSTCYCGKEQGEILCDKRDDILESFNYEQTKASTGG